MTEVTIESVVSHYMDLRGTKERINKERDAELAPVEAALEKIEAWLLAKMNADGVDSYRTAAGTPYKSVKTSVTMADRGAFLDYVFRPSVERVGYVMDELGIYVKPGEVEQIVQAAKGGAAWQCVDLRVSKKGIEEVIESAGEMPAGINRTQVVTVNVRKN